MSAWDVDQAITQALMAGLWNPPGPVIDPAAFRASLAEQGYAVGDKAILHMALLVLCAAEKGQDWHPNFRKDITCAIDGLRAMLAAAKCGGLVVGKMPEEWPLGKTPEGYAVAAGRNEALKEVRANAVKVEGV